MSEDHTGKTTNGISWAIQFGERRMMERIAAKFPEEMLKTALSMHPTYMASVAEVCPQVGIRELQEKALRSKEYLEYPSMAMAWASIKGADPKTLLEFFKEKCTPDQVFSLCQLMKTVDMVSAASWMIDRRDLHNLKKMIDRKMVTFDQAQDMVAACDNDGMWYSFAKNFEGADILRFEEIMLERGREPYLTKFRDDVRGAYRIRDFQIVRKVMDS